MITNVKMEVTPDLSKRVQEIVFANGGKCKNGDTEIINTEWRYLFISDKEMYYNKDGGYFKNHSFKKISAYDFIASQGQQKWLPRYDEECEFSDNKEEWYKQKFITYNPTYAFTFITSKGDHYKYCRSIKQTKVITINGKDIEISKESFDSLKEQLCED